MKYISTNSGNIYVNTIGKGVKVVVLHGGPGMSSSYLIEALTPLSDNLELIFFDQISCGKSEISTKTDIESTLSSSSEVIKEIVGNNDYYVIAHSWGAFLLTALLDRELINQPSKVIFCNPTPFKTSSFNNVGTKLVNRIPQEILTEIGKLEADGSDSAGAMLMEVALPYYCGSTNTPNLNIEYRMSTHNSIISSLYDFDYEEMAYSILKNCLFFFGETDYIGLEDFADINKEMNFRILKGGHFAFAIDSNVFLTESERFFLN